MKRVNVVGTSGSGKSHFSHRLAAKMKVKHIEMDALYWQPEWQGLALNEFLKVLELQLKESSWVLDGNHSKTNQLK